jgi:hypothetical protein
VTSTTEVRETGRGRAPVYRAGALAWLDSLAGMIPVTAIAVIQDGCGWTVAPASGEIRVRVNADGHGYRRDEIITAGAHDIVPRAQRTTRRGRHTINPVYVWVC